VFTHSSIIKKARGEKKCNKNPKENLTASGEILVFRIAGECRVMWSKLKQTTKPQRATTNKTEI